jgi:N-glycosylase/DNA lyase
MILYIVSVGEAEETQRRRERLKKKVSEIASRRKAVTIDEMKQAWNQLRHFGHEPTIDRRKETVLFSVKGVKFGVSDHHRGGKHVKPCYVDEFLSAMSDVGIYGEEDENSG